MKVFAIFGTIEFIDDETAYVRESKHAAFMDEEQVEQYALNTDCDYIMPHYYAGRIIFTKFHKEN
jgi:hypothetical protein